MESGFYYDLEGTWLGGYNHGPLGHPGDGEYNYYPITKARIEYKYLIDQGIHVTFSGETERGRDQSGNDGVLPTARFEAEFLVEIDQFKTAFEIDGKFHENFVNAHFK